MLQELTTAETDGRSSAITDQIPQRPVGVVEGTSYSVMILAALGVCGRVYMIDTEWLCV